MKKVLGVVLYLGVFLYLQTASAGDISKAYQELVGKADYTVYGTVCEQLAKNHLDKQVGEDYYTKSGIQYNKGGSTLGELDIVVSNRATDKAVMIVEVKCWQKIKSGLNKAHKQLKRFRTNVANNLNKLKLKIRETKEVFYPYQFDSKDLEYLTAAQKGSVQSGYDMEFDYTLEETVDLWEMLLDCQHGGKCNIPKESQDMIDEFRTTGFCDRLFI